VLLVKLSVVCIALFPGDDDLQMVEDEDIAVVEADHDIETVSRKRKAVETVGDDHDDAASLKQLPNKKLHVSGVDDRDGDG
jgi:hypothetical protein